MEAGGQHITWQGLPAREKTLLTAQHKGGVRAFMALSGRQ